MRRFLEGGKSAAVLDAEACERLAVALAKYFRISVADAADGAVAIQDYVFSVASKLRKDDSSHPSNR